MSFETLNIDVAIQISNKILFKEFFGDSLSILGSPCYVSRSSVNIISSRVGDLCMIQMDKPILELCKKVGP